MAITYCYEPENFYSGWFDRPGRSIPSWYDIDLIETGTPKTLNIFTMPFVDDDDLFLVTPPITVVVFPGLYLDPDLIFSPTSMRPLFPPDDMLKNEVTRIR
jgi:hypothetical protein